MIAHNGGLSPGAVTELAGDPLAVGFAPQREILDRASLTLTHAGPNTVLDSLAAGVPIIATPITYEQPAIAARVKASGAGISIPPAHLTAAGIRECVRRILQESSYRESAKCAAQQILHAGGVTKAASVIESIG